jgi:ribosomal protein L37AE/L43A
MVHIVPNKSNKELADIEFSGKSYRMACPICADLRVGKVRRSGEYTLYHCSACDVVFAHPMKTSLSVYEDSFDYRLRNELTIDPLQWERRWDIEEFMKSSFRKKTVFARYRMRYGIFRQAHPRCGTDCLRNRFR